MSERKGKRERGKERGEKRGGDYVAKKLLEFTFEEIDLPHNLSRPMNIERNK